MSYKYARDEYERRFLVTGELPPVESVVKITDRYITDTRLRLRHMEGEEDVWKLGKIEDVEPGRKRITNLYLSSIEAAVLKELSAVELTKERRRVEVEGKAWSIDCYPTGHVIAEVEHDPGDKVTIPSWCGEEVTGRADLSGYALAVLTAQKATSDS